MGRLTMRDRYFFCDGLKLHALEREGDGPTVVLVHGWLDHAHGFDWLVDHLPASWRVLAIDLRGHGESSPLPQGSTDAITDNLADLEALLRECCPDDKVHLVGHSRGGSVALLFAAASARVASLTVIESLGMSGGAPERLIDRLKLHQTDLFKPARRRVYPTVEAAAQKLREQNSSYSDASALYVARFGTRPVEGGVEFSFDPKLKRASGFVFDEDQVLAVLRACAVPRQVICGSHGLPFDDQQAKRRLAALGLGQPLVLEGGHHVHLDAPAAVAVAIRTFVDAVVELGNSPFDSAQLVRDLMHETAPRLPLKPLDPAALDPHVVRLLPAAEAKRLSTVPVERRGELVVFAMAEPTIHTIDQALFASGFTRCHAVVSTKADIEAVIDWHWRP